MTKVKSEKSELKCTWIKLEREGVKLNCGEKG